MVEPACIAGGLNMRNKVKGEVRNDNKDFALSNGIIY